jgi:hypothetical protein
MRNEKRTKTESRRQKEISVCLEATRSRAPRPKCDTGAHRLPGVKMGSDRQQHRNRRPKQILAANANSTEENEWWKTFWPSCGSKGTKNRIRKLTLTHQSRSDLKAARNKKQKQYFSLKSNEIHITTEVTALPPSFDWKLKIVLSTLTLARKCKLMVGEVARSPISLGSYL